MVENERKVDGGGGKIEVPGESQMEDLISAVRVRREPKGGVLNFGVTSRSSLLLLHNSRNDSAFDGLIIRTHTDEKSQLISCYRSRNRCHPSKPLRNKCLLFETPSMPAGEPTTIGD